MPKGNANQSDVHVVDYDIHRHTLDNGLRVVINPDPIAPAVAVNIWYDIGSGDERAGMTGFAHLFEHLMFQGSAQVRAGEHLTLMQSSGASVNATTSFDRTNYFETVPPGALELALWLEADRMASLALTPENLENQRSVVKEEKRQRYDNVPYGDLFENLLALNFPTGHPYHHPTIGSMADLDAASMDAVIDFHDCWYRPSNAVLTLSGAITVQDGIYLAEQYFGALPSTEKVAKDQTAPLPAHSDVPRLELTADVPTSVLMMSWRSPQATHPDHLAVNQALTILGEGQSSILMGALVRHQPMAQAVSCWDLGLSRGTSLASISVREREADLDEISQAVVAEIEALAAQGPTGRQLSRAQAAFEREWLQALAPVEDRADQLSAFTVIEDDPHRVNRILSEVKAVTAEDIARVCQSWLAPQARSELHYLADSSPGAAAESCAEEQS